MGIEQILPLSMFPVLLMVILSGYPVAFTLSGTALVFALLGHYFDLFYLEDLGFIPLRVYGIVQKFTLVAVPLFVFMGLTLEKSGVARELLTAINRIFQRQRGSLAIGVVVVGAMLAASTGIVGATVVTMGVLSLPTMLEYGYDKKLATGSIAAAGTLGQIIPPSIVLVLLGDMMNVDVGDLFVGSMIPGLLLVGAYILYIRGRIFFSPDLAPKATIDADSKGWALLEPQLWRALGPPLFLVSLVLGSILGGLASPTEAAACGALGALIVAFSKRKLNKVMLQQVMEDTAKVTAMVFFILVGAQFFGVVFRGLAGDELITELLMELGLHRDLVLFLLMVLLFGLGFFLDFLEICFIVIPIVLPIMTSLGYEPLWLGVLIAVNLQTSFLTPPFGFALFYLKGVAPPEIKTGDIYKGVMPFVLIQIGILVTLVMFPQLVTYLPYQVFK